jgi:allophanate hydrolase subunit 1
VIARTPLQIVDPEANHFPLTVGDQIRFIPISQSEYEQFKGQKL